MFRSLLLAGLCISLAGLPVMAKADNAKSTGTSTGIARDSMIVRVATGKAEKKTSSGEWLPIPIGADLVSSDIIRTGKNSTILLELPESAGFIRLLPETEVKVNEIKIVGGFEGGQIAELSIVEGKVITNVRKFTRKSSRLKIHTKGATAAVRGTSFMTSYNNKNKETKVLVGDGAVAVDAEGKQVMVNPKEFTKVNQGSTPSDPSLVGDKLVLNINSLKSSGSALKISGETDPEAEINLNDVTIFPNSDGDFSNNLYLNEGENKVVIRASTIDGRDRAKSLKVLKFTE